MAKERLILYLSPKIEIMEIKAQAIICQSGSTINDLTILGDDSENWK